MSLLKTWYDMEGTLLYTVFEAKIRQANPKDWKSDFKTSCLCIKNISK